MNLYTAYFRSGDGEGNLIPHIYTRIIEDSMIYEWMDGRQFTDRSLIPSDDLTARYVDVYPPLLDLVEYETEV